MNIVSGLIAFIFYISRCTSDNQYMTTLFTTEDETNSDISATTADSIDEFNATASTPYLTTINSYYSVPPAGGITLSRDRMGAANSHYLSHKDKPKSTEENAAVRAPIGSVSSTLSSVTETSLTHSVGAIAKPTKYHYYPHNQHMYLLPECAVQQVCSAIYVRLNYTQPLCACPSRYREPCSASLNSDDLHTTELSVDSKGKVLTLVKTCEPVKDMRLCRTPRDWSLLALQNVRTGKSHYLVICHCPDSSILEGPATHDQPTYASVPGIKVYGMVCVNRSDSMVDRKTRFMKYNETVINGKEEIPFPFHRIKPLLNYVNA